MKKIIALRPRQIVFSNVVLEKDAKRELKNLRSVRAIVLNDANLSDDDLRQLVEIP